MTTVHNVFICLSVTIPDVFTCNQLIKNSHQTRFVFTCKPQLLRGLFDAENTVPEVLWDLQIKRLFMPPPDNIRLIKI